MRVALERTKSLARLGDRFRSSAEREVPLQVDQLGEAVEGHQPVEVVAQRALLLQEVERGADLP